MNFLEKIILSDEVLKEGNILKVTGFLNHLIDVNIVEENGIKLLSPLSSTCYYPKN